MSLVDKIVSMAEAIGTDVKGLNNSKVNKELGKGLIEPAPEDGKQYARKDGSWVEVTGGGGTGDVEEAPQDNKRYVRQQGQWKEEFNTGIIIENVPANISRSPWDMPYITWDVNPLPRDFADKVATVITRFYGDIPQEGFPLELEPQGFMAHLPVGDNLSHEITLITKFKVVPYGQSSYACEISQTLEFEKPLPPPLDGEKIITRNIVYGGGTNLDYTDWDSPKAEQETPVVRTVKLGDDEFIDPSAFPEVPSDITLPSDWQDTPELWNNLPIFLTTFTQGGFNATNKVRYRDKDGGPALDIPYDTSELLGGLDGGIELWTYFSCPDGFAIPTCTQRLIIRKKTGAIEQVRVLYGRDLNSSPSNPSPSLEWGWTVVKSYNTTTGEYVLDSNWTEMGTGGSGGGSGSSGGYEFPVELSLDSRTIELVSMAELGGSVLKIETYNEIEENKEYLDTSLFSYIKNVENQNPSEWPSNPNETFVVIRDGSTQQDYVVFLDIGVGEPYPISVLFLKSIETISNKIIMTQYEIGEGIKIALIDVTPSEITTNMGEHGETAIFAEYLKPTVMSNKVDAGQIIGEGVLSSMQLFKIGGRSGVTQANRKGSVIGYGEMFSLPDIRQEIFIPTDGSSTHASIELTSLKADPSGPEDAWNTPITVLTTGNTVVDGDGFIKAASPVISLFNDRIEKTDYTCIQNASMVKESTGVYKITNVPKLAEEGWYLETPVDRNKNIYFTVDWIQDEVTNDLTIRTYEPSYTNGRAENGEPTDIFEDRPILLRFNNEYSEEERPKVAPSPKPQGNVFEIKKPKTLASNISIEDFIAQHPEASILRIGR